MARASEHTPTPSRDPSVAPVSAEGTGQDLLSETFGGLLSMEVVGSMHERKAKMASLSTGGFVSLPGGYGTLEELLEMVTWNQIGMHSLPVVVLNVNNFFTPLRALFEHGADEGFIKKENLQLLRIVDLPGGAEANADISKAGEWGEAALRALKEWHIPVNWRRKLQLTADRSRLWLQVGRCEGSGSRAEGEQRCTGERLDLQCIILTFPRTSRCSRRRDTRTPRALAPSRRTASSCGRTISGGFATRTRTSQKLASGEIIPETSVSGRMCRAL